MSWCFSWQIWDASLTDNSKVGDELYLFRSNYFVPIHHLEIVSQICISDLPWKHQHITRWRLYSRLWYRHYSGPHDAMQVFFSWGASMNSRGWTHYHLYSSVPNSSACTFINFEEKIHPARPYLGLHVYLFQEKFPPCTFIPPYTFIDFFYFSWL